MLYGSVCSDISKPSGRGSASKYWTLQVNTVQIIGLTYTPIWGIDPSYFVVSFPREHCRNRHGVPVLIDDSDLILGNLLAEPLHLFEEILINKRR